jgi:hypothetical protein
MASPMREKRAWPPQDKEDRAESIAFEQTVAVVRETVARSGQVLSSAKEDLTDHQRWLRDQAAAVQADRARHDRWLQRQRERQEAFERREQSRLRRRQRRQRAVQAVTGTISAVALSISSAVLLVVNKTVGGLNYIDALAASGIKWVGRQIRDSALYVARQVRDAVRYVANLAARGASWTGRTTGDIGRATGSASSAAFSFAAAKIGTSAQATGRRLSSGFSFVGSKTSAMARSTGKALAAGSSAAAVKGAAMARSTSRALSAGSSFAVANSAVLVRSTGSALSKSAAFTVTNAATLARETGRIASASFAWTSTKVHEIAPPVARFLSVCFEGIGARATDLSRAAGKGLSAGSSVVATKTAAFMRSAGAALAPTFAWMRAKAYAVAPSVAERIGRAGLIARKFARERAANLRARFTSPMPARAPLPASAEMEAEQGAIAASQADVSSPPLPATENALSLPRRTGGFELSQMLIVTGTVLLVLGCLMLGGGLILRVGTPAQVAPTSAPESPDSLVWFFEAKDRPLAERSIFIFTGTTEGVRIKGFSISAENKSNQPLTGVSGILKPDVEGPDMPLSVIIDMPKGETSLAHPPEASAAEANAAGIVPAHSVFRLIFPFPEEPGSEQQGVTPEEVVQTFGGLMLKVHYDVAGKEKAFMYYLSPAMLKEQLTEIEASAKGS